MHLLASLVALLSLFALVLAQLGAPEVRPVGAEVLASQRQLSQLGQLGQLGQQLSANASTKYANVLEALAGVGKALQQQMAASGQIQIVSGAPGTLDATLANQKKTNQPNEQNEYQSIQVNEPATQAANISAGSGSYREQGELLRQEIVKRAGQLQQVVAGSMDLLKNNGDLIVRRLLEQLNHRLDQAKSKADRIINEPANNEVAIKALGTINQGLNNLNNVITNIVNRLDLSSKEPGQSGAGQTAALDASRLRSNLHQLGRQFSSALNAGQQRVAQWQQAANTGTGNTPTAAGSSPLRQN